MISQVYDHKNISCYFRVVIIRTSDFQVLQEIDSIPKTSYLMFSPKGSILATWEPYTGRYATIDLLYNIWIP